MFKHFLGLSRLFPIYWQVIKVKINNGMAILTRVWICSLLGQPRSNEHCLLTVLSLYSKKIAISCSIISFSMFWRISSWYVSSNICLKPSQMGRFGLFIAKTCNKTRLKFFVQVRSWWITWISSSCSHLSNTSITIISLNAFGGACFISKSGCNINFSNWSFKLFRK